MGAKKDGDGDAFQTHLPLLGSGPPGGRSRLTVAAVPAYQPKMQRALRLVLRQRRDLILPTPLPPIHKDLQRCGFCLVFPKPPLEVCVGGGCEKEAGSFPGPEPLRAQAQKRIPSSGDMPCTPGCQSPQLRDSPLLPSSTWLRWVLLMSRCPPPPHVAEDHRGLFLSSKCACVRGTVLKSETRCHPLSFLVHPCSCCQHTDCVTDP